MAGTVAGSNTGPDAAPGPGVASKPANPLRPGDFLGIDSLLQR